MKNVIPFFVCLILFSSCHHGKDEIVYDFIEAANDFKTEKISQFLADSFMFYSSTDTLNKDKYLARLDSSLEYSKLISSQRILLSIQNFDSIIKTEEQVRSIIDSCLDVTPLFIQKRTYRFVDDKLMSITVDSVLNYEEYSKSLHENWTPFAFYVKDKYGIDDWDGIAANLRKFLSEYSNISSSEKKQYKKYAYLQGTYVSKDGLFFRKLIFRGKRTVTIVDALLGFPFSTSYELDEDLVKLKMEGLEYIFYIQDSQTLIGEGFAKGTFVKVKE